ncbi:RNA polymerase sigma factor [Sphingosinicella rhizophila]|uniref:Sigma-70 family RNA polymerase sigma factor n=1 Tax=Sphingosinicella rhizophila TaxID=3050082 RepID=A0ABU3Q230_9SPHN|nr:sigma-70 family RNA polymerase sigma factor [Sphingosinicella sp. GR2756]MDT9597372.1 sigma-70 family RNA polymerase sigma factor [Sphingosinicella sp. GR2756]
METEQSWRRRELVAWVAGKVMPHEPVVRAWLSARMLPAEDIDDLIQEGYCRLSALDAFKHVENPGAFFLTTVRNILANRWARARVVRIDAISEIEAMAGADQAPSPERMAGDRRELGRVRALIAALPHRCRRIVELRRIDGRSQREVAEMMGVPETIVENESVRGLRLIMDGLRAQGDRVSADYEARRPGRGGRS